MTASASPRRFRNRRSAAADAGPAHHLRPVKQAMVHDWGSRDAGFLQINREVLDACPDRERRRPRM